jgi:hypothetical protein
MAAGIIQQETSVGANTQVDDVLVNNILAFNRQGLSVVDWSVVADATGILVALLNGVIQLAPEFAPAIKAAVFPIWPDDYLTRFGVMPADRILLKVRNTTGAAIKIRYTFKFQNVNVPQ